jgi:hypothetical protein
MRRTASDKGAYEAPRVIEFGKVVDLTASGTKNADENGKGNMV